jgi:hypothetical protein
MMRVPITDPLWQVRLTQQGLMPSAATLRMARLLEAIRQDQAVRRAEVSEAKKGEGDDKR